MRVIAMLGKKRVQTTAGTRVVDHEEVVGAAAELIEVEGLFTITENRLAAALDLPSNQLHVDLDAVVAQAYRRLTVEELAGVRRIVLANPSPVEQMRALIHWLAAPPEGSDTIRLEAWALTRRNPGMRKAVQEGEAGWHSLVASVVRRGARIGEFPQADADEVAALVISLVDGINAYQLIGFRSDFDRTRILTRVLQAELGLAWGPELADALS